MGTARLPLTFSSAGIVVDVTAPPGCAVLSSSRVSLKFAVDGGARAVAEKAVELAPGYDRVITCDEPLLQMLLEMGVAEAEALLPASFENVKILTDKTLFPEAAHAAGIPVPCWRVARTEDEVRAATDELGGAVVVKGAHGYGGTAVRFATSAEGAAKAARTLGLPVVIEQRMTGQLAFMACLFVEGRLSGAIAGHKRRTISKRGPSTVVDPWVVDGVLADIARRAGERFRIDGFVSFDLFREPATGDVRVIELNPRPVPTLYLGKRLGVDMAALYAGAIEGRASGEARFSRSSAMVPLFPQELQRLRRRRGELGGTARWLVRPGSLREVPWGDPGLVRHYMKHGV